MRRRRYLLIQVGASGGVGRIVDDDVHLGTDPQWFIDFESSGDFAAGICFDKDEPVIAEPDKVVSDYGLWLSAERAAPAQPYVFSCRAGHPVARYFVDIFCLRGQVRKRRISLLRDEGDSGHPDARL